MVDLALITTAYTGLKFIKDSLDVAIGYKIENESREKINAALREASNVMDILFKTQAQMIELQTENEQLRQQLKIQEDWENQKSQYQLKQTEGGAVVYVFTQTFTGLPEHYACPSCFTQKTIQILQAKSGGSGIFLCPNCNASYPIKPETFASPSI